MKIMQYNSDFFRKLRIIEGGFDGGDWPSWIGGTYDVC